MWPVVSNVRVPGVWVMELWYFRQVEDALELAPPILRNPLISPILQSIPILSILKLADSLSLNIEHSQFLLEPSLHKLQLIMKTHPNH